jgi:anti-sigma factor RsiW
MNRIDLHSLVDGELSTEESNALRRELEASPRLMAEYESLMAMKRCLATKVEPMTCEVTWAKCKLRFDELDKARRVEGIVGRYSWALCGVLFAVILLGGIAQRGAAGNRIQTEDIAQMASTLSPITKPNARDTASMNAYLDALLGQARAELAPDRLVIESGAVGEFYGRRIARLTLRDNDGPLSLMVISAETQFEGGPFLRSRNRDVYAVQVGGMNGVAWRVGGGTAFLIGERSYDGLGKIVDAVCIR